MSAVSDNRVIHIRDMAFMGIVNEVLNLGKIQRNMKICKDALLRFQPDCVILVDYPGFNLKIAKFVKEQVHCPVYYYISPKLWAWKSYRIRSMKRYIDRTYTIFPFETEYFKRFNYEVNYVGNPTVDTVSSFKARPPMSDFRARYGLDSRPIIALIAGSRKQEIKGCLPIMLEMESRFPDYQFVVAGAPGIDHSYYDSYHTKHIVFDNTYELMRQAAVAVINSGTATLEASLLETPHVVVYHVFGGRVASLLKRILIKIPYVSLTNLVAGKEAVTELLAHHFTANNLEKELHRMFDNADVIAAQRSDFKVIIDRLGSSGTADRAAAAMLSHLQEQ